MTDNVLEFPKKRRKRPLELKVPDFACDLVGVIKGNGLAEFDVIDKDVVYFLKRGKPEPGMLCLFYKDEDNYDLGLFDPGYSKLPIAVLAGVHRYEDCSLEEVLDLYEGRLKVIKIPDCVT